MKSLRTNPSSPHPPRRSVAAAPPPIPRFALYGEAATPGQELLHIEEVQSRSRVRHWEIDPHTHQGLYQVLWVQQGSAQVMLDEWRQTVHPRRHHDGHRGWCMAFALPPIPMAWC